MRNAGQAGDVVLDYIAGVLFPETSYRKSLLF